MRLLKRLLPTPLGTNLGQAYTHFCIDLIPGDKPYVWIGLGNDAGGGRMLAAFPVKRLMKLDARVGRWFAWWEKRGRR